MRLFKEVRQNRTFSEVAVYQRNGFKMEVLNTIIEIISRMTEEEITSTRSYLTIFNSRGKKSHSITLFDILSDKRGENEVPPDREQLENILYGKQNPATFSRLLLRLKDKILESLIIDINVNREGVYDDKAKATIEVRKNISQAQILQGRGLLDIAQSMLEKVISQGKKYETYEELLLALRLLIEHHTIDHGDKHFQKLLNDYKHYDEAKNAVLRAEVNHGRVNAELDYRTGQNAKMEWLRGILDELLTDYKNTSASVVGHHYYFIEAQYYQLLGDYKSARQALKDNFQLLDASSAISTKLRKGNILLNLAENDLYLHNFKRSYTTACSSLTFFKPTSFNQMQGIELMFYAQFFMGYYGTARDIILQLVPDIEQASGTSYRLGKRLYLLANTSFMLEDFSTTYKLTSLINPIENDKEGWNIGIRILSILSLIEDRQLDEATAKIAALREFLYTLDKATVPERLRTIYIILQKLSSTGFDFRAVHQKEKEKIDLLAKLKWLPRSPEMIIFDQWLFAKVSKQKFIQKIPEYQSEITIKRKPITIKSG